MKDYNDDDNRTIVIREKQGTKYALKGLYKSKILTCLRISHFADRCTRTGTPHILGLFFFFSMKGTVNFNCLELGSWRIRSSGHRTLTNFPVSC